MHCNAILVEFSLASSISLMCCFLSLDRPELERQKNELVVESAKNRNKLHSLEGACVS